jgi:hypothetical protein
MADTFQLDLQRFCAEREEWDKVQKEAQRLSVESSRRADNVRALVQLIAWGARENNRAIPLEVAEFANQCGMSHIVLGIPIEHSGEQDASEPSPAPDANEVGDEDFFASSWIVTQAINRGADGISVPEILQLAKAAGIRMHHNYPYNVLRRAVQDEKVIKIGSRYLKKP